jgi:hypothetical protein
MQLTIILLKPVNKISQLHKKLIWTNGDKFFNLSMQAHTLKNCESLEHIILYKYHLLQHHIKLWYMTLHILRLLWA